MTRSTSSRSSSRDGGAIVVKFWLQISKAEQLRRFQARENTPFKRFKITPEDWRNRKKWDAYESRGLRHGRSHQHRDRAVDAGRGGGQELRAHQGPEDDRRPARARAEAMSGGLSRAGVAARQPRADDLSGVAPAPRRAASPASASTRPTATSSTSTGSTRRRDATASRRWSCCSTGSKATRRRTTRAR